MSGTIVGGQFVNPDRIVNKLAEAFEAWANEDVNDYFRDQFLEDKWIYDGETIRKNGETVNSPRNIFDLGDLYRSGRDTFRVAQGGTSIDAQWNWNAKNNSGRPYAWYVHEGLGTNLAPRQWTDIFQEQALFDRSPVSKELKMRIRNALNR